MNIRGTLIISVSLILAACDRGLSVRPPRESESVQPLPIRGSVRVSREMFIRSLLVSGQFAAVRSVKVDVPPSLGRGPFLIKALVPEGSYVRAGDLLVQFDNSSLVAALRGEEINLDKAENDAVRREAELEAQLKDYEIQLGRTKLESEKARLKAEIPKELLAARDWADYQFAFEKAQKEFEKTAQGLELFKRAAVEEVKLIRLRKTQISSRISRLRAEISAMEIRAPQPGTVLYELQNPSRDDSSGALWKLRVGDSAYWGMTLVNIPDLGAMEVRAFVSEVDAGVLRAGMRARIVPDAHPQLEFGGAVDYIPEVAVRSGKNASVRVFTTRIKLDRTAPEIMKPGMSVRVELLLEGQEGLVLPRRAVFQEQGKNFVQLVTGEKREVKIRARNPTRCLIEGLSEGTEVLP